MSRPREFEKTTMHHGNQRVGAIKMTCGKCGAVELKPRGATKTFVDAEQESRRFANMFERVGWNVGKRAQEDRCPKCMAALGAGQPKEKQKMGPFTTNPTPPAAKPREMSREDGRLIFAKIEEVYRDEKHGYQSGWTDHKVAEDLGVPRAWVEGVRKQFFGPEGGNPEINQIIADAKAFIEQARGLVNRAGGLAAEVSKFSGAVENIQRRIDDIEKAVR